MVARTNNQKSWRLKSPEPTKIISEFSTRVAGFAGSFFIIRNWPVLHGLCVASFPTGQRRAVPGDQSLRLVKLHTCSATS